MRRRQNLVADPVVSVMPEGQMFYSVTYGKGAMGPYGSQLTTSQRWRIVQYVKGKQVAATEGSSGDTKTKADSTSGAVTSPAAQNPQAGAANQSN